MGKDSLYLNTSENVNRRPQKKTEIFGTATYHHCFLSHQWKNFPGLPLGKMRKFLTRWRLPCSNWRLKHKNPEGDVHFHTPELTGWECTFGSSFPEIWHPKILTGPSHSHCIPAWSKAVSLYHIIIPHWSLPSCTPILLILFLLLSRATALDPPVMHSLVFNTSLCLHAFYHRKVQILTRTEMPTVTSHYTLNEDSWLESACAQVGSQCHTEEKR